MNIFTNLLALLAGCGVFIAGMNMLSEGLERSAGGGMKRLLARIDNRFAAVGIGAAVTAIIQSSSATSVMVIGFVNAGVMTLFQATGIIMGANIGTTVTGLIVSLSALDISLYASALAFVGVMMTFMKSERVKHIGGILCGFGLLFIGLELMGDAFGNEEIKGFFANIFATINFPLLLILCGAFFTALIQSSSAATGLVIVMVGQGALSVEAALFIVLGSNIGTCVTAVLAAIGTNANAKRTALIHLTFNVVGTALFTAFLWPLSHLMTGLLTNLFPSPEMQIAWFHVIFNVTTTLVLLPFIRQLVAFAEHTIRDKAQEKTVYQLKYVDDLLLKTPSVAAGQVKKEIEYMATLARENLDRAFLEMNDQSGARCDAIVECEAHIDFTNHSLSRYLVRLSPLVDTLEAKEVGAYFHVLNDLERIGDHAENFMDISVQMKEEGLQFSPVALEELANVNKAVDRMFALALESFDSRSTDSLEELARLEEEIDVAKKRLSHNHFERLATGDCRMELSAYFFSTITGFERISDHLLNIGYSILNPTGSQAEDA